MYLSYDWFANSRCWKHPKLAIHGLCSAESRVQLNPFPASPGDTIVVQSDFDRLRVWGADISDLEAPICDGLMASVDQCMRNVDERKAIVVFTDGVDNQLTGNSREGSRTPYGELFRRIQESDTIICTIFPDSEADMRRRTRISAPPIGCYPRRCGIGRDQRPQGHQETVFRELLSFLLAAVILVTI